MIYRIRCTMQTYQSYLNMKHEFNKKDALSVLPYEFRNVRNLHYKIVYKYPSCPSKGMICYRMRFTVNTTEDEILKIIENHQSWGLSMDNVSYKLIKE